MSISSTDIVSKSVVIGFTSFICHDVRSDTHYWQCTSLIQTLRWIRHKHYLACKYSGPLVLPISNFLYNPRNPSTIFGNSYGNGKWERLATTGWVSANPVYRVRQASLSRPFLLVQCVSSPCQCRTGLSVCENVLMFVVIVHTAHGVWLLGVPQIYLMICSLFNGVFSVIKTT
jgi:hypothetical protein